MARRVAVVGTGQTYFMTRRKDASAPELVYEATARALQDAELSVKNIDSVVFGIAPEAFMGVNCPDKWVSDGAGALNKPFFRVHTGGATGGSAVIAAVEQVASGVADVVLAVAMDRVGQTPVAQRVLGLIWDPIFATGLSLNLITVTAMLNAAMMEKYGYTEWHTAKLASKNHKNALNNPYAHLKVDVSVEDVLKSPVLSWPIKLLEVCPSSDGACAVIVATEEKARKITSTPAWVSGMAGYTYVSTPGNEDVTVERGIAPDVRKAYRMAGIDNPRQQIDVAEPYMPFSFAEISAYVQFGFAKDMKEAIKMVEDGFGEMTGEVPFAPSGGVLCANPIGCTAMVRVAEAAIQIMGKGGERQVPGAKVAVAQGQGGSMAPASATFSNAFILAKEPR